MVKFVICYQPLWASIQMCLSLVFMESQILFQWTHLNLSSTEPLLYGSTEVNSVCVCVCTCACRDRERGGGNLFRMCLSFCRFDFFTKVCVCLCEFVSFRLSEPAHCWSVVFINSHRHLIQMAAHLKF